MAKVVFIETPSPWLVRQYAQVPLGTLYLATILDKAGHVVRLARPRSVEDLDGIRDFDVVSFSGTTLEYPQVEDFAKACRARFPHLSIWYGGPHATAMADSLPDGLFDAVCLGEGDFTVLEMMRDFEGGVLRHLYGPKEQIHDLDSIPIPNRKLIEGSHGGGIFSFGVEFLGSGHENVITSRGCHWDCHFCSSRSMSPHGSVFRSSENVLEEVDKIVRSGCRQIRFSDDNFTSKKQRLLETCEGLGKMDVIWRCSARADTLIDREICQALFRAGCREVSVGVESGDPRVLSVLNKRCNPAGMEEGCRVAADYGLNVRGLFMIGTPGEHEDTPEVNRDFISRVPFHSLTLSTFVPLPGSAIWSRPGDFDCEILCRDFRAYNRDLWVNSDGNKKVREGRLLVRNLQLSESQQIGNIQRMRNYVLATGKCNIG